VRFEVGADLTSQLEALRAYFYLVRLRFRDCRPLDAEGGVIILLEPVAGSRCA
jgi:hypothetical protein